VSGASHTPLVERLRALSLVHVPAELRDFAEIMADEVAAIIRAKICGGGLTRGEQEELLTVATSYAEQSREKNRLIAEAADIITELLEALEGLLATHKQGRGQCCDAADRAIDAIAKARGEA
jgi:hypothetical protein